MLPWPETAQRVPGELGFYPAGLMLSIGAERSCSKLWGMFLLAHLAHLAPLGDAWWRDGERGSVG